MKSRALQLLDKSVSAMICAIEVYNKPDFKYREETFTILALNAWELLLKAKLLDENDNKLSAIYEYERRQNKDGSLSEREYIKRNRAGNPMTVSFGKSIAQIDNTTSESLKDAVKSNLDGMLEIRDNAIHFMNTSPQLAIKVQELGTANIQNYVNLVQRWFDKSLDEYNFYLMPLGFIRDFKSADSVALNQDEKKLLQFIRNLGRETEEEALSGFHVTLEVDLKFQRSKSGDAAKVRVTNDPEAPEVRLSEENIREKYPWDYWDLTRRLQERYEDFKINQKYHSIRKPLLDNPKYVKRRYLDPDNPKSGKKDYYNPNIFKVFDKHYTKK